MVVDATAVAVRYFLLLNHIFSLQIVKVSTLTGEVLTRIKMPVPRVTSVTFGDSFQTLYVTTSMLGLSRAELQKYPSSGALFSISNLNVIGHPNNAASNCMATDTERCFDYESTG